MSKKLVKADAFAVSTAVSNSKKAISNVRKAVRTESKILNFKLRAESNQKRLASVVKGLLQDFERYHKNAQKFMDKTGQKLSLVMTHEVRARIAKPYHDYLKSKFNGVNSIEEAIDALNEKRIKDIAELGRSDELIKDINEYYDSTIKLYLKPLEVLEAALNSTVAPKKKFSEATQRGTKILLALAEDAKTEEETQEIG
jgi:hypothetical protein